MKFDADKIILEAANQGMGTYELMGKSGVSKNTIMNTRRGNTKAVTIAKVAKVLGMRAENFILKED
jgi:transcriptional regulator with XRE-family HTH domain